MLFGTAPSNAPAIDDDPVESCPAAWVPHVLRAEHHEMQDETAGEPGLHDVGVECGVILDENQVVLLL